LPKNVRDKTISPIALENSVGVLKNDGKGNEQRGADGRTQAANKSTMPIMGTKKAARSLRSLAI